MEKKFTSVLASLWSSRPPKAVLLACSGGMDSMALAHLMLNYAPLHDLHIALAYAHYGLRSAADQELTFVRRYAKRASCGFHTHAFGGSLRSAKGVSLQAEARRLRYAWFQRLCAQHGYAYVLTAHHMDDDIETFFLNVLRGTSWRGLRGMPQMRHGIVRPLLDCTRAEIQRYAEAHRLRWCEDESNAEARYLRNRIRHELMPTLRVLQPQFARTFDNTRQRMRRSAWLIDEAIARFMKTHLRRTPAYDCLHYPMRLRPAHQTLIAETLQQEYGLHVRDFERLWDALCAKAVGRRFATRTHILWLDRNKIYALTHACANEKAPFYCIKSVSEAPMLAGNRWRMTIGTPNDMPYTSAQAHEAYLDADRMAFPLTIRGIRAGDYVYPLGMKGKKKLSDLMIDAQVPHPLKKKVLLLSEKKGIAWVMGHCIDRRFKVQKHTQRVLHIAVSPPQTH